MILAIYLSLILVIVSSQKEFYEKLAKEIKISDYVLDSLHLSFVLSLVDVNNPKTNYIIADPCIVTGEYVICGDYSIKKFSENYEEEVV